MRELPVPAADDDAADRRPLRILLAEDNPVNQEVAVGLLEKRGHTVVVANDGKEALAALEGEPFDLVLMDVQMPEMDGFDATAAIRQKEQGSRARIPIIALTAHAMTGDRERSLAAGMDGYVAKPIRPGELFNVVERLAAGSAAAETAPPARRDADEVLDAAEALARVGGDGRLLSDLAELFLDNCTKLLSEIKEALDRRDGEALARAAHTIKGSVGNFAAKSAFELALRLETLGRKGDLTQAKEASAALEREIERLKTALLDLHAGPAS